MNAISNSTSDLLQVTDRLSKWKIMPLSSDPVALVALALLPILLAFVSKKVLPGEKLQDKLSHVPYSGGEGSKRQRLKEYKANAKKLYSDGYRSFNSLYRVLSPEGVSFASPFRNVCAAFRGLHNADITQEIMSAFRIICSATTLPRPRMC